MQENNMPAAEAASGDERELVSYELAFHVLPTVAEGEVATVFQSLKDIITKNGGELFDEEVPARFDLAFEIVKYLEGRNRKFSSAYFGWVRFKLDPAALEEVARATDGTKELLRHLLIKLTKTEEENPFRFHEALVSRRVETVEVEGDTSEDDSSEGEDTDAESTTEAEEDSADNGEEETDKV